MSRDLPILFQAPMIRGLIADRKTQTRRMAWRAANKREIAAGMIAGDEVDTAWAKLHEDWGKTRITPHRPPLHLWVREAWHVAGLKTWHGLPKTRVVEPLKYRGVNFYDNEAVYYRASYDHGCDPITYPSIHMPRWASRLTLVVSDIRRERLQDISDEDALAEGIVEVKWRGRTVYGLPTPFAALGVRTHPWLIDVASIAKTPAASFAKLWRSIHGKAAWEANPEIIALTFDVEQRNIDAPPEAAGC